MVAAKAFWKLSGDAQLLKCQTTQQSLGFTGRQDGIHDLMQDCRLVDFSTGVMLCESHSPSNVQKRLLQKVFSVIMTSSDNDKTAGTSQRLDSRKQAAVADIKGDQHTFICCLSCCCRGPPGRRTIIKQMVWFIIRCGLWWHF